MPEDNSIESYLKEEKERIFNGEVLVKLPEMVNAVGDKYGLPIWYTTSFCSDTERKFRYTDILGLKKLSEMGIIDDERLKVEGFSSIQQLQTAYDDIAKKAAVDYINATINAIIPPANPTVRLNITAPVNTEVVNWYVQFEQNIHQFSDKCSPEVLNTIISEFKRNPGEFLLHCDSVLNKERVHENSVPVNNVNEVNTSEMKIVKNELPDASKIQSVKMAVSNAIRKLFNKVHSKGGATKC